MMLSEIKDNIKGRVIQNEDISRHTTFRIGGPAEFWVEPSDTRELKKVLALARKTGQPFFVIGGGSNLLVNDSGVKGIVIHLGAPFFKKACVRGTRITVGAGYNVSALVRLCCDNGLAGMESLVGIPGTVGGAIFMNAGGSANPIFKNIGDHVDNVKVMDYEGRIKVLKKEDIRFGYRKSSLEGCIILQASLKYERADKQTLKSSASKFLTMKKQKQALDMPSAGCVFKNPEGFQFTCGQMIDMLGLKGKKIGGAEISEKHANFIINRKGARAADVIKLIDFVRGKVKENYNIDLELEVKIV